MLGILVAVVIGLVIAFVYTLVSKKDGYNKSFIIGLALFTSDSGISYSSCRK